MQQNAAVWASAVVFFVLAAVFGVMFFYSNAEIRRLESDMGVGSVQTFISAGNENVRQLQAENLRLLNSETGLMEQLNEKDRDIGNLRVQLTESSARIKEKDDELAERQRRLDNESRVLATTRSTIQNVSAEVRKDSEAQLNEFREMYRTSSDDAKRLQEDNQRLTDSSQRQRDNLRQHIGNLENQIRGLQQQIARYSGGTTSGVTVKTVDTDGEVLEVDLNRRMVMIDVGRFHKARPGMRFEVVRPRGNEWLTIAEVEIVRTEEMISEAVILEEVLQVKRCPQTQWETSDPDMKYSPFALAYRYDAEGNAIDANEPPRWPMELQLVKYETVSSMDPLNPVNKGDRIRNPMFNPEQRLKFVLVGDPIRFNYAQIKLAVENYGAELSDTITPDVNYIIVCSIPPIERTAKEADEIEDAHPSDEVRRRRLAYEKARSDRESFETQSRQAGNEFTTDSDRFRTALSAVTGPELKARAELYNSMVREANAYGIPMIREIDIMTFLDS